MAEAYELLTHGYKANSPILRTISRETGRNVGQVLIRCSLQHGYVLLLKTMSISPITFNLLGSR